MAAQDIGLCEISSPQPQPLVALYPVCIPALREMPRIEEREALVWRALTAGTNPPFFGASASTSRRSWELPSDGYRGPPQPGSPDYKLRLCRLGCLQLSKDNDSCHSAATRCEPPFLPPSSGGQGLDMLGKCTLGHILGPKRALSGHTINQNPKEEVNDLRCPKSWGQLDLAK